MKDVAGPIMPGPEQQAELERQATETASANERRRQASRSQGVSSFGEDAIWGAVEVIGDIAFTALDAAGSAASCAGEAACAVGGAVAEGAAAVAGGLASALTDL